MRRIVKTFRGIDDVRNMLKDANKDLASYEKIEGQVESKADKIENIYDDFLKKFDEFKNFKEQLGDVKEKVNNYETELDKVKELDKEILKKSEFNDFSGKIHGFIESLEKRLSEVHVNASFINDLKELVSSLEAEMGSIVSELTDLKKNGSEEVRTQMSVVFEKQDNNAVLIGSVRNRVEDVNHRINSLELSIQGSDLASFDERLLLMEKSVGDSSSDIENLHQALIMFSEGQDKTVFELSQKIEDSKQTKVIEELTKKVDHLNKKIVEAEERETKIIGSVKNIIDLLKAAKPKH